MTKVTAFPVIDLAKTGRMIERSRKAAGLSVKDVQTYFGFEYPQAVYKWQHGECLPSVDNLLALSRLLGTPMEDLLVFEDQEVPYFWRLISMYLKGRFSRLFFLHKKSTRYHRMRDFSSALYVCLVVIRHE